MGLWWIESILLAYPSWIKNTRLRKDSPLFNSSIDNDKRRGCLGLVFRKSRGNQGVPVILHSLFNLIPHHIALGQAAETTAVQSISNGVDLRRAEHQVLRTSLEKQGAILPG